MQQKMGAKKAGGNEGERGEEMHQNLRDGSTYPHPTVSGHSDSEKVLGLLKIKCDTWSLQTLTFCRNQVTSSQTFIRTLDAGLASGVLTLDLSSFSIVSVRRKMIKPNPNWMKFVRASKI